MCIHRVWRCSVPLVRRQRRNMLGVVLSMVFFGIVLSIQYSQITEHVARLRGGGHFESSP